MPAWILHLLVSVTASNTRGARSPGAAGKTQGLLRVELYHEVLIDVRENVLAIRKLLERAGKFLVIDLDPLRKSDLGLDLQRCLNAQLLLRLLAHGDDVACFALIRRHAHRLAID